MIRKLRLGAWAGPAAMAVLVVSAGWVLWNGVERSKEASRWVKHTYSVLDASGNYLSTLREIESAMRAYLISHNRSFDTSYRDGLKPLARDLDKLDMLTRDNPDERTALQEIRELSARRLAVLDAVEKEIDAGRDPLKSSSSQLGEGPRLMAEVTDKIHQFEAEERSLLEQRTEAADDALRWTRVLLLLTTALLAVILFFSGMAMQRYVRTREESRESLQRLADLIDFSHDAVITVNPHGIITGWNAGATEIYGWTSAEALGRPSQEIVNTAQSELGKINQSLAKTGRWDGELKHSTKDGGTRIVESRYVQVRRLSGEKLGVLHISRDQTQRRQAEESLKHVAEQRRLALDAAELGSWDYDVLTDSLTWDERCRDMMGLPGFGPAKFEQAFHVIEEPYRESSRRNAQLALSGGSGGRFLNEFKIRLLNGSTRWIASYGRVFFADTEGQKRAVRVIAVNSDITERKRVEEELRESQDRLRVALDTGRIGIFNDWVNEGRIAFDEQARQLIALNPQGVIDINDFPKLIHPDDRERMLRVRQQDIESGSAQSGEVEYRIVHPNGEVRWLIARRRVYAERTGDNHRTQRVLGVLLDITEQKRAEEKLKEALAESDRERRRLQAILYTMPAGVVVVDRDGKLIESNVMARDIWSVPDVQRLGAILGELRGWRADTGERLRLTDWPRVRALCGEAVPGEMIDIERFDGSRATVFNAASPVLDASGQIQGAVGVMVDITEQRQIELALRKSEESLAKMLEQKTILFQEVQHRVKNNLQIVSSLLSLEAQRFQDSAFHNALNESRDRIRSMALMHEKFYHLDDLARIEFSDYVEELARYFFSSYIGSQDSIDFFSNVDVKLDMGTAIPCGLILQELLSNSVKHAFPNGKGAIRIDFHSGDGRCRLCYRDTGPGLPASVDFRNPGTLGLQLVNDLAGQLQGDLEYSYQGGAEFKLEFAC